MLREGEHTKGPKERAYDANVFGLMDKVAKACLAAGISMVASFELDPQPGEGRTMMCSTILLKHSCVPELKAAAACLGVPKEVAEAAERLDWWEDTEDEPGHEN